MHQRFGQQASICVYSRSFAADSFFGLRLTTDGVREPADLGSEGVDEAQPRCQWMIAEGLE
jgi:hypothetical protein